MIHPLTRKLTVVGAFVFGILFASVSSAQETVDANAAAAAPVAFVYVTYQPSGSSTYKIAAYAAAADGALTKIPGSPFVANVYGMAVNGKYLFGSNWDGIYVASFRIESNGALQWTGSTDVAQNNPSGCNAPSPLVLDHTGADLYLAANTGGLCDHTAVQTYAVEETTGKLRFIGTSADIFLYNTPLTLSANNRSAYGGQCVSYQTGYVDTMSGLVRASDGMLNYDDIQISTPKPLYSGDFYCRSLAAADPANHVAISMQAINSSTQNPDVAPQLAAYTADDKGNLTTTNTYANMPEDSGGYIFDLAMAPSGKLLAVAEGGGLEVFHFNGAAPITADGGLQTTAAMLQVYWDNDNHLYAINQIPGKLFVYTATATGMKQAPGSPYSIPNARGLIVQPKTPAP